MGLLILITFILHALIFYIQELMHVVQLLVSNLKYLLKMVKYIKVFMNIDTKNNNSVFNDCSHSIQIGEMHNTSSECQNLGDFRVRDIARYIFSFLGTLELCKLQCTSKIIKDSVSDLFQNAYLKEGWSKKKLLELIEEKAPKYVIKNEFKDASAKEVYHGINTALKNKVTNEFIQYLIELTLHHNGQIHYDTVRMIQISSWSKKVKNSLLTASAKTFKMDEKCFANDLKSWLPGLMKQWIQAGGAVQPGVIIRVITGSCRSDQELETSILNIKDPARIEYLRRNFYTITPLEAGGYGGEDLLIRAIERKISKPLFELLYANIKLDNPGKKFFIKALESAVLYDSSTDMIELIIKLGGLKITGSVINLAKNYHSSPEVIKTLEDARKLNTTNCIIS